MSHLGSVDGQIVHPKWAIETNALDWGNLRAAGRRMGQPQRIVLPEWRWENANVSDEQEVLGAREKMLTGVTMSEEVVLPMQCL